MEKPLAPFTAVLMAGGKSTRMGRDKSTLEVDGKPLWQHQIAKLQVLAPSEMLISGRADGPWKEAGLRAVPDTQENAGPLGGLVAVLTQMKQARALVLAIDLPAMTSAFLHTLLRSAPAGCGVVPEIDGRFEPLAAVYPRSIHTLAAESLQRGELSLQRLVHTGIDAGLLQVRAVSEEERRHFRNLNTLADLAAYACTRS